ncbi:MAG TPA: hypothetical protein VF865_00965 [Acidobacteriaceae bacterium]
MAETKKMSSQQLRSAYREAVEECLVTFYRKDKRQAHELVSDWWTRLSKSRALRSGLFMHAEPIETAANLAEQKEAPITDRNRKLYQEILEKVSLRVSLYNPAQLAAHGIEPIAKSIGRRIRIAKPVSKRKQAEAGSIARKRYGVA